MATTPYAAMKKVIWRTRESHPRAKALGIMTA